MSDIKESLNSIREEFDKALEQVKDSQAAEQLRVSFLGKKGQLTQVLKGMGGLTAEERPVIGKIANDVRSHMESRLEEIVTKIKEEEKGHKLRREVIDVTIPSDQKGAGSRHPLNMAINEICDIFLGLGYSIAEGPEVEYDKYNFELLRIPEGHPARDTQDTFYFNDKVLLRTQTSGMQIRVMEQQKPPLKVICPGKPFSLRHL